MVEDLSGQRLYGYLLLKRLGKGTFGQVYLARDEHQGIQVAVKILNPPLDDEYSDQLADFLEEARAIRYQHPNIVPIRDFRRMEDERYFLVMDYMPGGNLRQRHVGGTRLPWQQVATYARQIAGALQYVHERGVVHRDVKPENLLVGPAGEILLSDFGIAITSYTWDAGTPQNPRGTPMYIAPEQCEGQAVRASDQYALGIVMYEWLAGHLPFQGTVTGMLHQHLTAPPPPLREQAPELSVQAEEIVLRMLGKNPKERFADMRKFLEALERTQSPALSLKPLTFAKHSQGVRSVKWSPDGRSIASAGLDQTVRVWDPASGAVRHEFHGHGDDIWSVAWSPDSRLVVSAGADATARVWEAATGKSGPAYQEHRTTVHAVAWSPDGASIASAGDDSVVYVWNASTGETISRYRGHRKSVSSVAWSPDGHLIASAGEEGTIHLWSVAHGGSPKICPGHTDKVTALAWSPDARLLASASYDGTVCIWDAATQQIRHTYKGHSGVVTSVAWSPGGSHIASGSRDGTIHIWAAGEADARHILREHQSWVNTLCWSRDGQYLASGSWDKTARIFHIG